MASPRPARARSRPGARALSVFAAFLFLLSLLSPLAATDGLAVQGDPDCPEGEVYDESTGQCLPDEGEAPSCPEGEVVDEVTGDCVPADGGEQPTCPEGEVLDETTGECVPEGDPTYTGEQEPTEDASQPTEDVSEPATIYIVKYLCPGGYDPFASDFDGLATDCNEEPEPFSFDVAGETDGDSGTTSGGSPNDVEFSGLTADESYTISESLPAEYGEPRVFCYSTVGGQEGPVEEYQASGGTISRTLESGEYFSCYWFNFPGGGFGTIYIQKYFCDPAYDWSVEASYDEYGQNCQEEAEDPAFFSASDETGELASGPTSGGPSYQIEFADLPEGAITISEDPFEGYTGIVVFCQIQRYEEQDAGGQFEPVEVFDGYSFRWDLRATEYVSCDVYNIPRRGIDVWVYKYYCPEGTGYEYGDYDAYVGYCTDPHEGIDFSLTQEGGESADRTTDSDGFASWENLDGSPYTLAESIPTGYGDPVLFCRYEIEGDATDWDRYEAPGGVYEGQVDAQYAGGYRYVCYWFNIPGGIDIVVYKYLCPEGTTGDDYATVEEYQNACADAHPGVDLLYGVEGAPADVRTTGSDGAATWEDQGYGTFSLTEELPEGYGIPVVYCDFDYDPESFDWRRVESPDGVYTDELAEQEGVQQPSFVCYWFNLPGERSTVVVRKWDCPEGTTYEDETLEQYLGACTEVYGGIPFTLTDSDGPSESQETDANGEATWTGVSLGLFSLEETIPFEYDDPVVYCGWTATVEGAEESSPPARVETPSGIHEGEILYAGTRYVCDWFNIPGQPGTLTIYKYTCPEGYDLFGPGADLRADCPEATNGITFTLDVPDGAGSDLQSDTGDSIEGAVTFGGLTPGTYTAAEEVPPGIVQVFVLDCVGGRLPYLRPYPLHLGNELAIDVAGGDEITCYWYDVPEDPRGKLTLYKYQCKTTKYVTATDCEVYEAGQEFDLLYWTGSEWDVVDTDTTDATGRIQWNQLEPGAYLVREEGKKWCMAVSPDFDDGSIAVTAGAEAEIQIYNCTVPGTATPTTTRPATTSTPVTQPKKPGKYPNTGVGPGAADAPAAPAAGEQPAEPAPTPDPVAGPSEDDGWIGNALALLLPALATPALLTFGRLRRRGTRGGRHLLGTLALAAVIGLSPVPAAAFTQDDDDPLGDDQQIVTEAPPVDEACFEEGTTTPESDDEEDAEAEDADPTAEATSTGDDDELVCPTGDTPVRLQIEALDVEADIEVLETVNGLMLQPTNESDVAWYKDTGRPDDDLEHQNVVLAGHLNWWNTPEAVFARIDQLRAGDEIVVTGESGQTYTYEVVAVSLEDATVAPADEVVGPAGEPSLTLITCGGQWDQQASEYLKRTVVRAVRTDPAPPEREGAND